MTERRLTLSIQEGIENWFKLQKPSYLRVHHAAAQAFARKTGLQRSLLNLDEVLLLCITCDETAYLLRFYPA